MVGLNKEEYEEIKQAYIENIEEMWNIFGGINPQISIIGKDFASDKTVIMHILLTSEIMQNDLTKTKFVNEVLPKIAKEFEPKCKFHYVIFASEAWIRHSKKENIENWKELPIKKEAFVMIIEGADNFKEQLIYDIERLGKQVNENGDLVDNIKLKFDVISSTSDSNYPNANDSQTNGIFNNLYKKIINDAS